MKSGLSDLEAERILDLNVCLLCESRGEWRLVPEAAGYVTGPSRRARDTATVESVVCV